MIAQNLSEIKQEIGPDVRLVVVSKYRHIREIREAYDCGQRDFAENRVQALLERAAALPSDIRWHLIGHLQSNKVKQIVPHVNCIQSVDSLKLLRMIDEQSGRCQKETECLLQLHIAKEESKSGLSVQECLELLQALREEPLRHVRLKGLMGMATLTEDEAQIRAEFSGLKSLYDEIRQDFRLDTLSMGMSSDYSIAVECGSNMVRIGSRVFG